ncbi:hypothetical protein [Nocardioides sp. zg-DK7169]|uniref:hypothetical protein n=1 Tax=Nocardioides sp. zg-DK7169 TaxID=2736600 RepID=UPI001555F0E5|nr:hypothetical protein [Nocardioides sp. zg-DK7169]NPC98926.1 hypothetical protein [Nocardioides sp. zg-DK7169]
MAEEHRDHTPLDTARASPSYVAWRDALPSFELDGERLYLPTGDVPVAEDELARDWLRRDPDHAE